MQDKIHILLVDDRPENLVALESLLDEPGRNLVKAQSGNEALQLVLEYDFALVLLDVQMPDMDGFETAELMRANSDTARVPIIFVTAINREERHVFRGYESGAVDYITKPIEPAILQSKVRVFCELYEQRKELEESRAALARLNDDLQEKNRQLEEELELAQTIQLSFLPTTFPREDRIVFEREYLICTTLGGDLFDAFAIDDQFVGVYMADVAGHGVSAALISGLLRMSFSSLRADAPGDTAKADLCEPDQILGQLHRMLVDEIPEDRFITMIYGVLDLTRNEMRIASAAHPPPIHFDAQSGKAKLCDLVTGPALGLLEGDYPVTLLPLHIEDKLLLYTDGITETMDAEYDEFGEERLTDTVSRHGQEPTAALLQSVLHAVEKHRASENLSDDCSLLLLQLKENGHAAKATAAENAASDSATP